jgi:hypothetical protein
MFEDLRLAVKGLVGAPGFGLTAVVTLALGIGANTLIFSLVYGVLLKPLPFDAPERLVAVPSVRTTEAGDVPGGASVRAMEEWRESSKTLERPAIYRSVEYTIAGHGDPERADACLVSESLLLVAAGAAVGWVLAGALLPAAVAIVAPDTPRLADVAMDLPVLGFTLPVRNRETGAFERYKYQVVVVDGDFFGALEIQSVRGRLFDARDTAGGETVFVVSRDFARRQFGTEDVVGRQSPFGPPDEKGIPAPATLVGVVDDVRYAGLDRPPSAWPSGSRLNSSTCRLPTSRPSLVFRCVSWARP